MKHTELAIRSLVERLREKAMRKSTPNRTAGDMYEAAEVIEQLLDRVNRWNPVTPETMPPEGKCVIACVDGQNKSGNIKYEGAYLFAEWYAKSGWWFDDCPEMDGADVKWWMDICDVPEEKGGTAG